MCVAVDAGLHSCAQSCNWTQDVFANPLKDEDEKTSKRKGLIIIIQSAGRDEGVVAHDADAVETRG